MGTGVTSKIDELLRRGTRDEQMSALASYARELLAQNDADGAHLVMDRAVRLDGRSAAAWCLRGEVLARRNRAGEALGSFDRALGLDPSLVAAIVGKADLLLKIGSSNEALDQYETAVRTEPRLAHLWLNRARALDAAGRTADAIASLDRALELSDAPATWLVRGEIQAKSGALEDARKSFERAVALEPKLLEGWFQLAMIAPKLKDPDFGKRACYTFLDSAPESDPRLAAVRSLLFQLDRHSGPVAARRPSPRISSSRMRRVSRSLKATPAPPDSDRSVADVDDVEDSLAELLAADALHRAGRHLEAFRKVEALVKATPTETNVWILRARVLLALDRAELAAESADRATQLDAESAAAWKLVARAAVARKKPERVPDALDRAERASSNDPEVHRLRGDWLVDANRHTEAVYAYEKAVLYAPTDPEAWLTLGRLLRLLRRADDARGALERARDLADSASKPEVASEARGLLARLG